MFEYNDDIKKQRERLKTSMKNYLEHITILNRNKPVPQRKPVFIKQNIGQNNKYLYY